MRVSAANLLALLLSFAATPPAVCGFARAPQQPAVEQPPDSDESLFKSAQEAFRLAGFRSHSSRRAEALLKKLLELYPQSSLRPQAEEMLRAVQEKIADEAMRTGQFWFRRFERGVSPNAKGAESRMLELTSKYPWFSRMDEALLLLGMAHLVSREVDEAEEAFKRLVREHPRSPLVKDACARLNRMGRGAEVGCVQRGQNARRASVRLSVR